MNRIKKENVEDQIEIKNELIYKNKITNEV
jgi:hypothetical protein